MKKRILRDVSKITGIALGLVLAMLVGVSSCKESSAGKSSGENRGGGTITLNLWHIHTQETRKVAIEKAVKRFETANPGVKVVVSIYENDPFKTKLKTVSGDDFPDIFHSWGGGWLKSFVDAGLVADITEESKTWADKVSEEALHFNAYNGKVYGSPYITSSTILYYNKTLFDKFNIPYPATYAELTAACDTFVQNGVIPFALGNRSKWPGAQHFVLLSMRLGGPDIFQRALNKEITFTDQSFIRAGEMLQDMIRKDYFPAGVNGINYDTGGSRMMFYTEQCAMILQTSGFMAACKSENPDFYNNKLGIGLYPAIEGGAGKATDILAGENAFSVSASSKNKALAAKLVGFLSIDEEFQREIVEGGSLPSLTTLQASDPRIKDAMSQIANATFLQNFIDQTLSPELSEVHKDTVQALFGDTMNSSQAAGEMQKAFDAEI